MSERGGSGSVFGGRLTIVVSRETFVVMIAVAEWSIEHQGVWTAIGGEMLSAGDGGVGEISGEAGLWRSSSHR
jgi:hypothetical protein